MHASVDDQRISILRRRCLRRKPQRMYGSYVAKAESLQQTAGMGTWQLRGGLRVRHMLQSLPLEIDDLELLAGRVAHADRDRDGDQVSLAHKYLADFPCPGQTGHCELDLAPIFERGIDGLTARITALGASATGEKADTYQSFIYALEGLTILIDHAAAVAEAAMPSATASRRAELQQIADSCHRIAHQPPRSFREAIQLVWLVGLAVMEGELVALVVPGHLDRILWPYYQADLRAGTLTQSTALLLIESLYVLNNEQVPDGLAMSVMVGGRDETGADLTNDLSYLCLEAIRRTAMIYPTVGICWHEATPQKLTDLAIDLVTAGYATPAFFADRTIQRGLADLGVPSADRCSYINSTCVEITPVGASNVWVASPYFNVCGLLSDEIAAQAASPSPSFDVFADRYFTRVADQIKQAVDQQAEQRHLREQFGRKPLQSVFTRDCITRGQDIDAGGAIYNWVECSFVGLANLVDSLVAIRAEVFDSAAMTLPELAEILHRDFAGSEEVRQRLLNAHPKYGNNDQPTDELLGKIIQRLQQECRQHTLPPGDAPFVPGCFCWIMHEQLGRETGATPDGRKAHTAFADGGGPAQGRERFGPTAAVLSVTSWDHSPMIGGVAFNMKFDRSNLSSQAAVRSLGDLVVTYLKRGGFETQINVVDHDTLLAARANPERYRDLVVRIGGYCDYFTRLSGQMQDELIMRTRYRC